MRKRPSVGLLTGVSHSLLSFLSTTPLLRERERERDISERERDISERERERETSQREGERHLTRTSSALPHR